MVRFLFGAFVVLHGLVHLWYVVLSQRLIEVQAEMGWTGRSWLLTPLLGDATARNVAAVLYVLATLGFAVGGVGFWLRQEWWRSLVIASAAFSAVVVVLFWGGGLDMPVERGLVGLVIDVGLLVALLVLRWPAATT